MPEWQPPNKLTVQHQKLGPPQKTATQPRNPHHQTPHADRETEHGHLAGELIFRKGAHEHGTEKHRDDARHAAPAWTWYERPSYVSRN